MKPVTNALEDFLVVTRVLRALLCCDRLKSKRLKTHSRYVVKPLKLKTKLCQGDNKIMANVQTSPSLSAKLKTKETAHKIKHGSPKLQELLRQRCRQRMKEKRGQLFNKMRVGLMEVDENVQDTLTEIVRAEFSQLATMDIDEKNALLGFDSNEFLTEDEALELESEILAEEEQWILKEYERLQQDEADMLEMFAEESLKEDVVCPLCEHALVIERSDSFNCPSCDFSLPLKTDLHHLGKLIQETVNSHSLNCIKQASFIALPENNTVCLYLFCETCSAMTLII